MEWEIEIESDTTWSGVYLFGTSYHTDSGSGNSIVGSGMGRSSEAHFTILAAGYLNVSIKLNGRVIAEGFTDSLGVYANAEALAFLKHPISILMVLIAIIM